MRAHNLGTVLAFEVRRTLSKPQIWLATLAVPVLIGLFVALVAVSNLAAAASRELNGSVPVSFTYADASGVVRADVAARLGGRPSSDAAADEAAVRQGRADLFIEYPADPAEQPVRVVARDAGLVDNERYGRLAGDLLRASAREALGDERLTALATNLVSIDASTWADGVRTPGWEGVVAPGLFLVLLYLTVLMLGNQMLNITVEEKENRVTEMILTTIHPTTLIVGKVVAVLVVGVVQMTVVGVPVLGLMSLAPQAVSALDADLAASGAALRWSDLALSPAPIALGAWLFIGGLLMFAGLLVAIGSVMPTAKDASSAFGIVVIAMFLPMYAAPLIVSEPSGVASRVLTFFPLTAPVTALLRNATGSLDALDAALCLGVIMASAAAFMGLGVRLFREGSISYGVRLPLRKALTLVQGILVRKSS